MYLAPSGHAGLRAGLRSHSLNHNPKKRSSRGHAGPLFFGTWHGHVLLSPIGFIPQPYRKRRPAENLTPVGQKNCKKPPDRPTRRVRWGHERDPAKPARPRPERRRKRLEGPDGTVL